MHIQPSNFDFLCAQNEDPPPLPITHPPPFGSGMPRGSPMKFTTFHQHHQLVAHPQHVPSNGSYNFNNNFPTPTMHASRQQHYQPQQMHHHHQQQQFFESKPSPNFVAGSPYSKMTVPPAFNHQQQRSSAIWHQQNDFNGNSNEPG